MRPKILIGILLPAFIIGGVYLIDKPATTKRSGAPKKENKLPAPKAIKVWIAPDTSSIPVGKEGELIKYGRKLISHTSEYLGPRGSVAHISNGMNCQNCHLNSGTKSFSNNFAMVASGYPRFRPRSARMESIEFRVNDCMQRSLNGQKLDSLSKEMRAYVAYFKWIGKDVKKGQKIEDAAVEELPFLDRAADPESGKKLYLQKCKVCHGTDGQGLYSHDSTGYTYPPLWGPESYNIGAGMYRLTRLAGFIKNNMPLGSTFNNPQVSNEEAWDIAAYINSRVRPSYDVSADWPDISSKPFDYPFGPYANGFSEQQHKFGPFKPIKEANERLKNKGKKKVIAKR